jgi:hypothetical protein
MNNNNNIDKKDNKPFDFNNGSLIPTPSQIDTQGPLLAEILRIVQRIDRRQEDLSNKFSRLGNDY